METFHNQIISQGAAAKINQYSGLDFRLKTWNPVTINKLKKIFPL